MPIGIYQRKPRAVYNCCDCGKKVSRRIHKRCQSCCAKGRKHTEEWKKKQSERLLAQWASGIRDGAAKKISKALTGRKLSEDHKRKIGLGHRGLKRSPESIEKYKAGMTKRLSDGTWRNQWGGYKGGVSTRDIHSLFNPRYVQWRTSVFTRDNYKCRIENKDCNGQLQAHHILPWRDFVELRYETNNGITLCHAHHPRKRAEEKRLAPMFKELVSVSKE